MTTAEDLADGEAIDLTGRVGTLIKGKWRIDALLGAGGMAAVYAATHRNGHRCALKMMLPSLTVHRDLVRRFLKEGYVANEVGHPGVVTILDDDVTEDGTLFLVMELLIGESFATMVERHPDGVAPADVVRIADDVLDVLAVAHERNVIHRDLKPDNIFVLGDGRTKVLDFGIARLKTAQLESGTQTGAADLLGTPAYMPPEQALGHWDQVDAKSDLWAIGATMYVALSGRPLRTGATIHEALLQAMTEPAPPIREVAPTVPRALAAVVDRALRANRDERWPTALEMRAALREAAALDGIPLTPPLGPSAGRRPSFRSLPPRESAAAIETVTVRAKPTRLMFGVAAAVAALLVLGVALAVLWSRPRPALAMHEGTIPLLDIRMPPSPPPPSATAPSASDASPTTSARPRTRPRPPADDPFNRRR